MAELTAQDVLIAGGWDTRYAVVLAVATDGDVGIAVIDTNGDGANIDVEQYWLDPEGAWVAGCSGGPVSDRIGVGASGGWDYDPGDGSSHESWVRYVVGRAPQPGRHHVSPRPGQTLEVTASDDGWWAHIQRQS